MKPINVVIMGAGGRDFHNFNVYFKDNPNYNVIAFTHGQLFGVRDRVYPSILSGRAYPKGIPIFGEDKIEEIILEYNIKEVFFSYSDISYLDILSKAAKIQSLGSNFILLSPENTMIKPSKKSVSITGIRTGVGKSAITRYIYRLLKRRGVKAIIVRHPMPYGDLKEQVVQRFSSLEDLDYYKTTIEEREDYEPHIRNGSIVYAGVDYGEVLNKSEKEGDVILWDGGNNDFPFYLTDINIVVTDGLRPDHIVQYYPSEINFRRANIIIINKVDISEKQNIMKIYNYASKLNPKAKIIEGKLVKTAIPKLDIKGKKVLVIEDGPTITHGGLNHGAGYSYAKEADAIIIDPKKFAFGSLKEIYRKYTHIGPVLPAIGYNNKQKNDLLETIKSIDYDYILSATPTDLNLVFKTNLEIIQVEYEFAEVKGSKLENLINI